MIDRIIIDYIPCKECKEYAMTCYKCGQCGRKFNEYGIMIDEGGTNVEKEEDDMTDEEKRKAEEISEKLEKIIDEHWGAMGDALVGIFTDAVLEAFNLGSHYPGAKVSAEEEEE